MDRGIKDQVEEIVQRSQGSNLPVSSNTSRDSKDRVSFSGQWCAMVVVRWDIYCATASWFVGCVVVRVIKLDFVECTATTVGWKDI